ncbi:hypothetical protein BH11CYA1_BH11CYA1_16190 [soil metagenome]
MSSPNEERINALESLLRDLHREKMELGVENTQLIEKALLYLLNKFVFSRSCEDVF